jgi:hypothetical protein
VSTLNHGGGGGIRTRCSPVISGGPAASAKKALKSVAKNAVQVPFFRVQNTISLIKRHLVIFSGMLFHFLNTDLVDDT